MSELEILEQKVRESLDRSRKSRFGFDIPGEAYFVEGEETALERVLGWIEEIRESRNEEVD